LHRSDREYAGERTLAGKTLAQCAQHRHLGERPTDAGLALLRECRILDAMRIDHD